MSDGSGGGYFLWLTDIHLDPYYATPQAFKLSHDEDAVCRSEDAPAIGSYGCEAPRSLVRAAIDHAVAVAAKRTPPRPDFVVVTGDFARHGVDLLFEGGEFEEGSEGGNGTATAHAAAEHAAHSLYHSRAMDATGEILAELSSTLRAAFPESEIVVAIGNNDAVPDYYIELPGEDDLLASPGSRVHDSAGALGVFYDAFGSGPGAILTPDDERTFLRGGYYSRSLHDGSLTVLSLNTVLYSPWHGPEPKNEEDPGSQFSWMRKVLTSCRENGSQVIILGHISPSLGSFRHHQLWKEGYIRTYYEIVREFDDLIIAQMFGHLHSNEFRVGLEDDGFPTSLAAIPPINSPLLVGPAVTPLFGNDPAFKFFTYGDVDGAGGKRIRLLDYDSYRFSIGADQEWSKLYTFSEVYGAACNVEERGLTSETFREIVRSMADSRGRESRSLRSYRSLMLSGADGVGGGRGANVDCDRACRRDFLCTFQSATRSGYEACLRRDDWMRSGSSVVGLAGAAAFLVVTALIAIFRWRQKRNGNGYASPPSVTEGDKQGSAPASNSAGD